MSLVVVAIDPGVTTGIAWLQDGVHIAQMLPYPQDEDYLIAFPWAMVSRAVCESFQLGAATLKKSQAGSLSTIERIGVVRMLCRANGVALTMQSPAEAKTFDPDCSKLKRMGWYTPGPDHARSASRHLLLACTKFGVVGADQLLSAQEEV
jgi:hypothetical protein